MERIKSLIGSFIRTFAPEFIYSGFAVPFLAWVYYLNGYFLSCLADGWTYRDLFENDKRALGTFLFFVVLFTIGVVMIYRSAKYKEYAVFRIIWISILVLWLCSAINVVILAIVVAGFSTISIKSLCKT